ncbi:MAG: hypothetical protein RQ754_03825 [Desulfuromonadales bacterium]|jgi:DNA-binding HxlR family transcriptional regulator|nr:hypothetical protein [Desulfuromonadales bacterium]
MTCNQHCLRFGELAVKMGFISQGQLNAALLKQEEDNRLNRHRVIGLILHDEGWLSTAQIEEVLKGIFLQPERPADGSVA